MEDSYTIADTWYEALLADVAVNDFCSEHFERQPGITLGNNRRTPYTKEDCPYIVILDVSDRFGHQLAESANVVLVAFGVKVADERSDDRGVKVAGHRVLNEFGTLILECLEGTGYPPAQVEGRTERGGMDFFERYLFITVNIPNTLG